MEYDVIVVGGGFTGVCAAIAAARHGAKALLFEQGGALGGAAVNCLVNPFMPNGTKLGPEGKYTELSQGLYAEICGRMAELGACEHRTFHEEYLKLVLDRMCREAGVKVLFHSTLVAVDKQDDAISAIKVMQKNGLNSYTAKCYIDATGDGMLSYISGVPMRLGRPEDHLCQPMTLCFRIGNIDIPTFKKSRSDMQALYKQMRAQGKIKNPREDVLIFSTLVDNVLHFNTTRIIMKNPVDPDDLSEAEMDAREQMFEMYYFLRDNVPGFEHSQLLTSSEIGVRESRMIDGKYILTGDDLVNCRRFDDVITCGNYDIDIHNPAGSGTSHYYFPEGSYYDVPYRALLPLNVSNLLVAGRCISVTHEAQASIRIMPICCTLGEAAGVASALAAQLDVTPENVPVAKLQQLLRQDGAFLGE